MLSQHAGVTLATLLEKGAPLPVHPAYEGLRRRWAFWELSYRGGVDYKRGRDGEGQPVFVSHELESEGSQARRMRLATYRNYCRAVVTKYNAFVFGARIQRDFAQADFARWAADVDALGTSLHDYMKRASKWAQVYGNWLSLIESSKTRPRQTRSQEQSGGERLYLIGLHPERMLHWIERQGQLVEALVRFDHPREARLYSADKIVVAELDEHGTRVTAVREQPNPFGRIPVVRTLSDADAQSQLVDIAEVNKSHFNLDALLREELFKQTFTQFFGVGLRGEELNATEPLGGRKILCVDTEASKVRFDRLVAHPGQADSIRASLRDDVAEIWRLAGLKDPDVTQSGTPSGRALTIQFNEVGLVAAAIAQQAERAENRLVELWARGAGAGTGTVKPSEYPRRFDPEDLAAELSATLQTLGSDLPATVKRMQVEKYAALKFHAAPCAERENVRAELSEMFRKK